MRSVRLAIVGATGIVGKTTLDVLEEWKIPVDGLRLISSAGSAGQQMSFRSRTYAVEELNGVPDDVDVAIFATSSTLSHQWAPKFRDAGVIVIDHSSHFRMYPDVPLVIPEINAQALAEHRGLVANPNCSASVMLLPLHALQRRFGLRQVIADTYQSVSGAGRAALDELDAQHLDEDSPAQVFPQRISQNVIPEIGTYDGRGVTGEEQKIGDEIRKILSEPELYVLTTAVRVPVRVGHAAAMTVQLKSKPAFSELESAMTLDGMIYEPERYRTPIEIAGKQEIFVGRLRQDDARPEWVQFWCVGDNLRKGAASNAVQILERLFS